MNQKRFSTEKIMFVFSIFRIFIFVYLARFSVQYNQTHNLLDRGNISTWKELLHVHPHALHIEKLIVVVPLHAKVSDLWKEEHDFDKNGNRQLRNTPNRFKYIFCPI